MLISRAILPKLGQLTHILLASMPCLVAVGISSSAAIAKEQVLVIHSYHSELSWTRQEKEGIDQGFQDSELEIQVFHEFLDLKRYPEAAHGPAFWKHLQEKYKDTSIDLLMVGDDPGLNLFLENRPFFLSKIPLIFFGINNVQESLVDGENMTGVFETHSSLETLLDAVKQTESEGIILISDSSDTGVAGRKHLGQLKKSPGAPRNIISVVDLISTEIESTLSQYPSDWPVYMVGQLRQGNAKGALIDIETETGLLSQAVANPLYTTSIEKLGKGVVGGKMLSGAFHTRQAVELAEAILQGTPVDAVEPVLTSQSKWIFDARQLKKHNIPLERLPAGSELRYQESMNRQLLIAILGITLVSSLIIATLTVLIQRQRRISAQLRMKQAELQIAQQTLENRVEERTQELAVAKDKAELANHAKSDFLAKMSHELRTPLNAILGFSQLLQKEDALPTRSASHLNIINRSGEHLLTLINDVLEMAKVESGHISVEKSIIKLIPFLEEILSMMRLKASSKGINLDASYDAELPDFILTDAVKLRQIIINLLGNAIKFTESGGVNLTVLGSPPKWQGQEQITSLQFQVRDTGPGMEQEALEKIFQAFVQAKSSSRSKEGTGLGLAISQQFSQLLGGQITVESELGQGSTFCCEIQATIAAESSQQPQKSSARMQHLRPGQAQYRLLVVDDNLENRSLLVELLESVGFDCKEASDGQEAINQFHDWSPHLVWMDLQMPVMDGEAAMRVMKTCDAPPVVIALTANIFDRDYSSLRQAGFDDLVFKPFRIEEIWEKLQAHLDVEFVTESDENQHHEDLGGLSDADVTQVLIKELEKAPLNWRKKLLSASQSLSAKRVQILLEEPPNQQAKLCQSLHQLLDSFRFDIIVEALQASQ